MHSLFFVHNTLRNDYLGQGRCRFIQVNNCSPGTGRHLYCTVLYCTVLQGGADTVLRAGEIIIKKLKWHKYTAANTTTQ